MSGRRYSTIAVMLKSASTALGRLGDLRRDELFRRLYKNVGYLLTGTTGASLLSLATLALTARALGPTLLGILVMIEAYARTVDRLTRLEPWQALIKYGADALERDQDDAFKRLIKFGVMIDVCGALFATFIAISGLWLVGGWLGWEEETIVLGSIYCLVLLTKLRDTPTAVLRLFDRFKLFAWRQILAAALRLVLVTIAYLAGAGLAAFVAIGIIGFAFEAVFLITAAWSELRRRNMASFMSSQLRGVTKLFPDIWRFIWSTNLSLVLRKSTEELDVLIVGSLVGPAAVGLYHIAKRLGEVILKVGRPLQQATYPELARLWSRGERMRFRRTVMQINALAVCAAVLALIVLFYQKELVVRIIAGASFADAATLLLVHMVAITFFLAGITLRPAIMSMGRQQALLGVVATAAAVFYPALFILVPEHGALGASLAHGLFNLVWLIGASSIFLRASRHHPDPTREERLSGDA